MTCGPSGRCGRQGKAVFFALCTRPTATGARDRGRREALPLSPVIRTVRPLHGPANPAGRCRAPPRALRQDPTRTRDTPRTRTPIPTRRGPGRHPARASARSRTVPHGAVPSQAARRRTNVTPRRGARPTASAAPGQATRRTVSAAPGPIVRRTGGRGPVKDVLHTDGPARSRAVPLTRRRTPGRAMGRSFPRIPAGTVSRRTTGRLPGRTNRAGQVTPTGTSPSRRSRRTFLRLSRRTAPARRASSGLSRHSSRAGSRRLSPSGTRRRNSGARCSACRRRSTPSA